MTKTENENYYCKKLGKTAVISREIVIHDSSRKQVGKDYKRPRSFDCDHATECDVSSHTSLATSFDWSKCVHPERK